MNVFRQFDGHSWLNMYLGVLLGLVGSAVDALPTSVAVFLQIFGASAILVTYRNEWVHYYRTKGSCYEPEYWSYDKMVIRFWIWDMEKMRNKPDDRPPL